MASGGAGRNTAKRYGTAIDGIAGMTNALRQDRSRFGLDAETSLFARLGSTLTLLVIGVIIGLIYLVIGAANWHPLAKVAGQGACEAVGLFFAVGLVYVWWRPPWLRHIYLYAEAHVCWWLTALVTVSLICCAATILMLALRL